MTTTTTSYSGTRTAEGGPEQVMVAHKIGGTTMRHPLVHFVLHSPDGFQWGYGGSGPGDLALAILLDHLKETPNPEQMRMGQPLAWRLHQTFKWDFVAGFGDTWELTSEQIDDWLALEPQQKDIAQHAKLWVKLDEYVGHEFGPPPESDGRMMGSDPAFRWFDAPTAPLPDPPEDV